MSAGSTMRANKSNKEKAAKIQQTTAQQQNTKEGSQKIKATAEQMRIANLLVDKADADEEQMEQRINQICDLTQRSRDDVIVALHDCNDDPNKAIEMLIEGDSGQGEWQETGKKKKKTPAPPNNNNTQVNNTQQINDNSINNKPDHKGDRRDRDNNREQSNDRDFHEKRSETSSRGRRNDDIPRFRGKNKNKENNFQTFEENDRNRSDSSGRGRGRGRGRGVGRGRGRGAGRTSFPPRSKSNFDKGPQIDTWTNDQANKPARFKESENWDNEDMNEDVWQGSLAETKVFTASNQNNDINSSMINDISDIGVTKGFGIGQNSGLTQSLDLSSLLQQKPSASMSDYTDNQSNQSISQYTKQATENIKSIVGIGTSQASVSQSQQPDLLTQQNNTIGLISDGMSSTSSIPGAVTSQAMPQRSAKPQRSKLPPPSKIPASAVEMPGHVTTSLDVQFGFTDQSGSLSFGSNDNSGLSFSNSTLSSKAVEPPSESTTISQLISNITPPKPSLADQTSTSRASMYSNSASTTPTKDYSQSPMSKSAMTPPDPYSGSQSDRKTSPLMPTTQRQSQNASQNNYNATYPSNRYQSHKSNNLASTTSGYSHSTNSLSTSSRLPTTSSYQTPANQYQSGYQSSTFQNQSGFPSGQNPNTMYQGSSNQSSFSSQSNYRDSVTTASYVSNQPSAYSTTQAGTGYQTGQTGASYTSGQSSYPSNQNSYQGSMTGQTGSSYQGSQNVASSYPSTGYSAVSTTNYQTGQTSTTYPSSVTPTNSSYTRESGQNNSSYSNYGSNSLQQNTSKLTDGLSKMTVNDTSALDSHKTASSFEHTATSTSSASLASTTATTSSSMASGSVIASGSVNVSNALGLTTAANVSSVTSSTSRTSTLLGAGSVSSASVSSSSTITSKAPPNPPPGVPLLGPNFIMGQPGMTPFYAPQQPLYSYEDLQLLQRLPLQAYYDQSLSLQQPATATSLATRDQNSLGSVPYTGTDGKMNRVDAQSPVQGPTSQPQSQSAQQQTFINPQLPPGYGYFYHGGMLPGGFSYTPTMFPVTPVTNAAHGGSTVSTTQFQKPGQYMSHDYGTAAYDLSQTQDYKSAYGTVSQNQSKASASGIKLSSSSTDMTGTGGYGKTHAQVNQTYDKQGYHAGTPPPFNLQMASGNVNQAGPMGTPTFTPVFPMMAHQQHSQMMHHQLQQDTATGSTRTQQATQPKTGSTKGYGTAYWGSA